jgi:predicted phosphodiesterase
MSIRLLILSDTHDSAFPDPGSLPTVDVVIHCGDLTMIGGLSNLRKALEALSKCPAELKLVIPGNHDVSLDPTWWAENLDEDDDPAEPERARELFTSFAREGVRLLEEGTHKISLQDGRSLTLYASSYTPEFNGYAFAYTEEEDRFNTGAHTVPPDADIVITHGPPLVTVTDYRLDLGRNGEHCGCSKLWAAIERTRPRLHCFGHIHEGYGSQVARWGQPDGVTIEDVSVTRCDAGHTCSAPSTTEGRTLLLNAAIMSHGGDNNKPWVVNVALS